MSDFVPYKPADISRPKNIQLPPRPSRFDRCQAVLAGSSARRCMKASQHDGVHSDTLGLWMDDESVEPQTPADSVAATAAAPDPVNHPSHYNQGAVECIDAIAAALGPEQFSGFLRGNALKYLWRCQEKGSLMEDLRKAAWYQERLTKHLAGE